MADRVYLEFFIHLTDEALVHTLQETRFRLMTFGGIPIYGEAGHPIMAPDDAADKWDAPIQLSDGVDVKVGPPNITSDYFTHEYSNFPRNRATFTIDGGGFWGWLPWVGDKNYAWRGTFIYDGPAVGVSPVPGVALAPMATRRWLDGMELNDQGENVGNVAVQGGIHTGRAASRSLQGYGLHVEDPSNANYREHTPILSGRPATHTLWERFYLRVHRTGLADAKLWKTSSGPNNGLEVDLLPSGQLAIVTVSATATRVLLGTFGQLLMHAWTKVDVVYGYHEAAAPIGSLWIGGFFQLYLNGVLTAELRNTQLGPDLQGLRVDVNAQTSTLGPTVADTSISLDLDDWIGADWPNMVLLSAKDWHAGSHVAYVGPAGFAADHEAANWTVGDWRGLRIRAGSPIAASQAPMTSAVTGARLSVTTDAGLEVDLQPNGRGIASMLVALQSSRPTAPANSGTLGYKLPGGADVLAAIAEGSGSKTWTGVYYFPVGLVEPLTPLLGLELKHVRGANVNLTTVDQLCAVVEIIGIFGPEDAVGLTAAQLGTPAAVAAGPANGSAALVQAVKDGLVARGAPLTGACGAFAITKRVAWALRARGGGLLSKPTGNNCEGYSTDIVAFPGVGVTRIFDMLIDGGGTNGPTWSEGTPVAADRYRAAIDPGDSSPAGTEGVAVWGATTAYTVGQRVTFSTSAFGVHEYVALAASTNQAPADATSGAVNATYWSDAGLPLTDPGAGGPIVVAPHVGLHNAPYPRSPWARGAAPFSPMTLKTGTYVGTGTTLEIPFDVAIHFLWIRPLTAGSGPVVWWPAMNLSHTAGSQGSASPFVEVLMDPAFAGAAAPGEAEQRCIARITGSAAEVNALGATYSYLAISDPGMRFLLSDALQVMSGPLDYVNPLAHESWTPEALFLQGEVHGSTVTNRLGYKGIGHAAAAITKALGAAETASGLQLGLGTLTLKTGLFTASDSQVDFVAFRRNDGSGDPGIVKVLQLATYVGDGNASRTIALAPASGQRPMWALIVPHTAVNPTYRDPSHTGVTSTTWPNTANATTGIVGGGVDQILIGIACNANGVTYDVFAIPGCDGAAGNGGWSTACETMPVAPWTPPGGPGGPWPPEPTDDETPPFPWPTGDGGPGDVGEPTDDFGADCVDASTKIINQALARLGIGKRVDDIVTEQSEEAATARLFYADDVSEVLRDYPWPFATRYAQLVWVAGSPSAPANGDWTYAYRAPSTMMFARRLVVRGGAGRGYVVNEEPRIDFRLGSDATGPLLYTNHADPGLVSAASLTTELEYTIRLGCAATAGDAIFRSALAWRHAHSLAPVLSRDEKKVAFCWAMYQQVLNVAETRAAQETQQPRASDAEWITGRE